MTIRMIAFASAVLSVSAWSALAQPAQMQRPSGGQRTMSAESLPEECRAAVQADGQMQNMQGMDMSGMMQNMQGMMANMSEARKGYMEAMMKMHGPMMTGMMIKDPEVAFICSMIPHHQSAIDMANVALKTGDNAEAKMMAEKVIKDQGQEITQMKEWLKKNTK
ncbi:DUF305 domain-containing protein [Microvirga antarctica]|uniref:DUF305 domain-containing protein n=1 Tax=Microvirga antarctica TaxID=2819233 RepID=UPI001B309789|nr:DUF305 domain-containing protein [Microvirga antarctica]